MNFRDYQEIMTERNLVSNLEAEQHLANAERCHENIMALADSDPDLTKYYQEEKDRQIQKAIEKSWSIASMNFHNLGEQIAWTKGCEIYRETLEPDIIAVSAQKRPFQTYGEANREFHRQMEAEKYEE